MTKTYTICVNGPGSSGKSSAAYEVSLCLKFAFLSTGNVYRAYTWALQKNNIIKYNKNQCLEIMKQYNFEFIGKSVFYNGEDIANDIGYEELAIKAAHLAQKSWYRDFINKNVIGPFIKNKNIVLEGRGLREVVPEPSVEFYIKSTIFARAQRRLRQYVKRYGVNQHQVSLNTIYKQIERRDSLDMKRKLSPLKFEPGMKVINNSMIKRIDTVKRMLKVIHKKYPELDINWKKVGTSK
ncbi:MAG: (d)CMP kinase [Mycoplasmataceae bacterium]|nr:(d)CMP kinase [Mycoplasmataceae bacterium]